MANHIPPEDIRSVPAGYGGNHGGRPVGSGPAWWGRHRPGGGETPLSSGPHPRLERVPQSPRAVAEPPAIAEQHHHLPAGTAPGDAPVILVVDDEPEVRKLIARQLMVAGYRVVEAGGGDEALLRFLEPPPPQLVVTDTRMPRGMSGIELIRQIRALAPNQAILRVSGLPNDPLDPAPTDVPFLAKPFLSDELLTRVSALCRQRS